MSRSSSRFEDTLEPMARFEASNADRISFCLSELPVLNKKKGTVTYCDRSVQKPLTIPCTVGLSGSALALDVDSFI